MKSLLLFAFLAGCGSRSLEPTDSTIIPACGTDGQACCPASSSPASCHEVDGAIYCDGDCDPGLFCVALNEELTTTCTGFAHPPNPV
jgi:hypothetical protein